MDGLPDASALRPASRRPPMPLSGLWLRCAQDGGPAEDKLEPPVPAGLEELSGPLYALIEFLEIDEVWFIKTSRSIPEGRSARFSIVECRESRNERCPARAKSEPGHTATADKTNERTYRDSRPPEDVPYAAIA